MSVFDQGRNEVDVGFVRSWDAASARRQFHTSLILVGALLCSAVVLASTLRFDQPMQEGRSVVLHRIDKSAQIEAPFAGALAPMR